MINPTHHLKKFVKCSGNDKPADFHITEERGWLGSGVTDCNGVEIFEGDIVQCWIDESNPLEAINDVVTFTDGMFVLGDDPRLCIGSIGALDIEVVGHIATE